MRTPAVVAVLATAVACGGSDPRTSASDAPDTAVARHVLESCVDGDSVVFSTVEMGEESGDISGVELTLRRKGDRWSGTGREAVGDFTRTMPLVVLRLPPPDSVALAMPLDAGQEVSSDTLVLRGRATCERLEGRQRDYRANPETTVTYRRHRPNPS